MALAISSCGKTDRAMLKAFKLVLLGQHACFRASELMSHLLWNAHENMEYAQWKRTLCSQQGLSMPLLISKAYCRQFCVDMEILTGRGKSR